MLHKIAIYVTNIKPSLRPRSQGDKTMPLQARLAGWWVVRTALAVVAVSSLAKTQVLGSSNLMVRKTYSSGIHRFFGNFWRRGNNDRS